MTTRSYIVCTAWFLIAGIAIADEPQAPDFNRELAPVLSKKCVACHNAKKAEGGLNLESYTALLAGGDSGPAITAGEIDGSLLIERVISDEDPMPPDDNAVGATRFTADEVDLFRKWVSAGALEPTAAVMRALDWQPVPEGLQPIYAIAASPDGNYLSYGRGSLATITRQVASEAEELPMQQLIDPTLGQVLSANSASPSSTHLDIVQSMTFSPDSQRLATGGFRTVKLWRRKTEPSRALRGLSKPDGSTTISSDGRWIAQRSNGNVIEITDCESGEAHRYLKTHSTKITAMAWLPALPHLVSCDEAGQFALTYADSYRVQAITTQASMICRSLEIMAENQLLVVDDQQRLHVGNLTVDELTGGLSLAFQPVVGIESAVAAVVAAPESKRAAVALADGKVKLLALPSFDVLKEFDAAQGIQAIDLNSAGNLVAAIPEAGPAHVWNADTGELLAKLEQDYTKVQLVRTRDQNVVRQKSLVDRMAALVPELQKAADGEVEATKKVQEARDVAATALAAKVKEVEAANAAVSEAEQSLVAAQAAVAEAMKIVEAKTAELEAKKKAATEVEQQKTVADEELAKREQALATANDSSQRAAAKIPEQESLIQAEKVQLTALEAELASAQAHPVATDQPTSVEFTRNGKQIVVAHKDSRLRIFSAQDAMPLANPSTDSNVLAMRCTDDNELICVTDTGVVQAWDLDLPWELERTIGSVRESPFSDRITALDFSPDGKLLAVGSGPPSRFGDIKLVNVDTGAIAQDLGEVHSDTVLSVQFSPDGRLLASGGADKLCRVFDVATGEMTRALEGHTHHVLGVAWKDDARTLITASADATLKVWDVESGTQQRTITGFSKEIAAVHFVGQGSEFVLASADGSARLYNADNGQQVRAFGGAANALYAVALSAENKQLYSGGQTGQVWAWRLEDAKLLRTLP